MPGVGTLIDMSGIIAGGATALAFGRLFSEQMKNMMMTVCGLSVFVIGITGIMQGMLTVTNGAVSVNGSIPLLISLVAGAAIGETMGIEKRINKLGMLLQKQVKQDDGAGFADGFVKASMVVGIGAMAVMGPITEGLYGDHSMLIAKAAIDFVIIMVLTVPYGKGCLFASLPVGILQGSLTLIACQAKTLLTDAALASLTTTGSIMIMCLGINLIWNKEIRVANMLPMVVIGVVLSYVPVL
ncbi:MAG: DUF554 domain-containing protein [Clostridia bacterium]|nr:DUF554 domain-containing protein [Clostridia bacterium]